MHLHLDIADVNILASLLLSHSFSLLKALNYHLHGITSQIYFSGQDICLNSYIQLLTSLVFSNRFLSFRASLVALMVKSLPAIQETQV